MVGIMQIDSAKFWCVVGQRRIVFCSNWEGEYVQGQFWTVVVEKTQLSNSGYSNSR